MAEKSKSIYEKIKQNNIKFDADYHCPLVIDIMTDPSRGTVAAFCVEAGISERRFYDWANRYPIFGESYHYGRTISRRNWEKEADQLKDFTAGEVGCKYEMWRLKGWSQFGVGKNSRIRLNVTEQGTPADHYRELLRQASDGDFTAGEIKQLMEAINVGLNAHNAFELQKQIDDLKSNLAELESRNNG